MNKVLLMLPCIMASFFICSMDQSNQIIKLSPRKSSGSPLQPVTKGRRLTDSDIVNVDCKKQKPKVTELDAPVVPVMYSRVRSQSRESDVFVKEENITTRTLQRTSSADKK